MPFSFPFLLYYLFKCLIAGLVLLKFGKKKLNLESSIHTINLILISNYKINIANI